MMQCTGVGRGEGEVPGDVRSAGEQKRARNDTKGEKRLGGGALFLWSLYYIML